MRGRVVGRGFGEGGGSDTALGRCASCLVLGLWERGFGMCGLEEKGGREGFWKKREFWCWLM